MFHLFSFVCTENFVFLFIVIARVSCQHVQCDLFDWSLVDHITLNDRVQNSLYPQIDSIYKLTALMNGVNELVVHTKSLAPEHMQVSSLD